MKRDDDQVLRTRRASDLDASDLDASDLDASDLDASAGPRQPIGHADDLWALSSSASDQPKVVDPLAVPEGVPPKMIGRYVVQRKLGRGGFAVVYLARDSELGRDVAIKVPRPDRFRSDDKLFDFIEEARKTAQFEHPGIVRVYDVLRESAFVYIVEQYIDGADLDTYAKSRSLSSREVAELMIAVADAVGYAHDRGFVHRDLKPANILIDHRGIPYVADFGLAVHECALDSLAGQLAGTYPYMSPEQIRGESHRLDRRSDIWSLGVILYQLLTNRLPFKGSSRKEAFSSIVERDPEPPVLADPKLSGELSRICLCCLAKRADDRFQSTEELIADLRHWLREHPASESSGFAAQTPYPSKVDLAIEPQGLRTFERRHANFFLQLLPGPHDREGLPKSVRFWKTRIESRNVNETFGVGLIYGPSGCGKSSMVQAGILPRLSDQILPVLIDASSRNTSEQITRSLSKFSAAIAEEPTLAAMLGRLRERGGSEGRKVLIVLDQFEQFLHLHDQDKQEQLALALRQADGVGVQVLVLVRDDFYGSVNRFFHRLEIPIMEGRNAALVDLFELDHARRVLLAFGRAYGRIPVMPAIPQSQHRRFIDRAVAGLAEEDRVNCVRLVVFAEMMKSRPWSEQMLRDIGGIEGVGVTFLQDQFSKRSSPPVHRLHEEAARRVLLELIPGDSSQLKGPTRTYQQLLDASGYRQRPADFETVLQILDRELRLITPTESAVSNHSDVPDAKAEYQLAHDYLTPVVRQWLNLHQMETRRGRAELRLDERSKAFAASPEKRNLPSVLEFFKILLLTNRRSWTASQRTLMNSARRHHLGHAGVAFGAAMLLATIAYQNRGRRRAESLVNRLLVVREEEIAEVVADLDTCRWAPQTLRDRLKREIAEGRTLPQVKLRLALIEQDPLQAAILKDALTDTDIPYRFLPLLSEAVLTPDRREFANRLRHDILRSSTESDERRFRAGIALALNDSDPESWTDQDQMFLAEQLIGANPEYQALFLNSLRPIRQLLKEPLLSILRSGEETKSTQLSLARTLADYCDDDAEALLEAISLATPDQFRILYEPFEKLDAAALSELTIETDNTTNRGRLDRIVAGRSRANAAIALLRMGVSDALPQALAVKEYPESLTQFVHGARDRKVSPTQLLECLQQHRDFGVLDVETPSSVLCGLLLALGEYELDELAEITKRGLVDEVARFYESHPSSGVHGAAGWLLRRWGKNDEVIRIDQTPVEYEEGREWFTIKINAERWRSATNESETFYLTFVVFEPGVYEIGSNDEFDNRVFEGRMRIQIPRRFAILDRELSHREIVTRRDFSAGYGYKVRSPDHPYGGLTWYQSVHYCRWLGAQNGWKESDQPYVDSKELKLDQFPRDQSKSAEGAPLSWPVRLERPGFRLPTEAEWEVACRAGTLSNWSFGDDMKFFDHYAWNSSNAVEAMLSQTRRPNLRGLFDMHGNRGEWCHARRSPRTEYGVIAKDLGVEVNGILRIVRGGSFQDNAVSSRSAMRGEVLPSKRPISMGLRIVMTLATESENESLHAAEQGESPQN